MPTYLCIHWHCTFSETAQKTPARLSQVSSKSLKILVCMRWAPVLDTVRLFPRHCLTWSKSSWTGVSCRQLKVTFATLRSWQSWRMLKFTFKGAFLHYIFTKHCSCCLCICFTASWTRRYSFTARLLSQWTRMLKKCSTSYSKTAQLLHRYNLSASTFYI